MQSKVSHLSITLSLLLFFSFNILPTSFAQTQSIGKGSYSTSLPSGGVGPQLANGANAIPKISSTFSKPIQTNDFWSSLIYPFFNNPHSNALYAHPLNFKATGNGLQMGYTPSVVFAGADFLFPFTQQLTVGISGLNASKTTTDDYGDWTVTALWEQDDKSLKATFGHGLVYAFFEVKGGNAEINTSSNPTIWSNQNGVLGLTIEGRHYGIFAPVGSSWSGTSTLTSSLNGKDYLSVALLPDANPATLELFRKHAYAFVTNSLVSWTYDESNSNLETTYAYETVQKESDAFYSTETMTALYRHQYQHTSAVLTNFTYQSARGLLKLKEGNSFTTQLKFGGVLPSLPDEGEYNRADLLALVQQVATEDLGTGPSYENGKAMGRFASLVPIAEQLGAIAERDYFIAKLKTRLEEWLTAGGQQEYSYDSNWDVLTGYPSGYGADNQINDHHFHASYAIMSAAIIAQYDPEWASQDNWGGMINLLIKDSNNWDRNDTRFPFLRTHDSYAGHSWAAGHGDFGDGNNQESSSESMNFASAVVLWGSNTHQTEIRDLGIFLHATETTAVENYWFDVDNVNFPQAYSKVALGMVWGGKGVHSTWFGANPEYIHGINFLPITSGSFYLGRHPDYVKANYDEIFSEVSGQITLWKDVIWQYLALSDASLALSLYYADANYTPFDGESKAHTLHWLTNLKKMGHIDTTVTASIPTYAVFKNQSAEKTYIAYNPDSEPRTVLFSDGFSFEVPARQQKSFSTSNSNATGPVALLITDKTRGKLPLTVQFTGNKSFDRKNLPITYAWQFGTGDTSTEADPQYIFTQEGSYKVVLTVTNEEDETAKDSTTIQVQGNGNPYTGTPFMIPGKIEAENYDTGGEGVSYHDVETNNIGLAYRPNEGVDIESANDGGFDVYWMVAGEWLEYTIEVPEDGFYDISPYVSTIPGFGNFRILINNEDVTGKKEVLNTGGWQIWKAMTTTQVPLKAGVQVLRFEVNSDSDPTNWLFSLNNIVISKSTNVANESDHEIPSDLHLAQNYPNPFNPNTQISFSIPQHETVNLTVYSSIGQHVKTLIDKPMNAGHHQVQFDASQLSNGLYIYQLRVGTTTITKKMLLMK